MSEVMCEKVHLFADGELAAAEADAFREHLAGCAACQAELHDLLQLDAMVAAPAPASRRDAPVIPIAWYRKRGTILAVAVVPILAAAAAWALWWRTSGPPGDEPVVLAAADTRSIEGRVAYASADRHRPYSVPRGQEPTAEVIPLKTLAKLEQKGDLHGVAAAWLLMGDPARALQYLERAPASVDRDCDRGLALLARGEAEDALLVFDEILEEHPGHPQAMWNRALALRDLGLRMKAAEAFDAIAEKGEPGWSEEARRRAQELRQSTQLLREGFDRIRSGGVELATKGTGLGPADVKLHQGLVRVYFYEAVRSAPTRERVLALLPLAEELDRVYGGSYLRDYLERTAKADFAKRGQLATIYGTLVAGATLDEEGARSFLTALRVVGAWDILFGALDYTGPGGNLPADRLDEYLALVPRLGPDPWHGFLAGEQRGRIQIEGGQHHLAEPGLLEALAACKAARLDYRCGRLAAQLTRSYLVQHRIVEGRRAAHAGFDQARRAGDWVGELLFLPQLANAEMYREDTAARGLGVLRAYLDELLARHPEHCDYRRLRHQTLANLYVNRLELDEARREMAEAQADETCRDRPLDLGELFVLAHVLRAGGTAEEVKQAQAALAALRAQAAAWPSQLAVLDHIEGRMQIDRDRAAGHTLLRRAIARADKLPDQTDARKARAYSYAVLILDAGRAGDYTSALRLLGEETGVPVADRCALGVAVEDERVLVVARDAGGSVVARYRDDRKRPSLDVSSLVPEDVRAALAGCQVVDVLARPPFHGLAGILPDTIAWRWRSRPGAATAAARVPSRRLVVSGIEAPPGLGLPRLGPSSGGDRPDVTLEGSAATPSRVLAEMGQATTIELHAHGLPNLGESDASFVVLSPEADGRYALTAGDLRRAPLAGAPVVILAACHVANAAPYLHESWSLPVAFLEAGARTVLASSASIPDVEAGPFFEAVRRRISEGELPAVALQHERSSRPYQKWMSGVMVFE